MSRTHLYRERVPSFCFAIYLVLLLALLQHKPLWLDEIIQQLHTRSVPFQEMLIGSRNPGASFLPDFFQWLVLRAGYTRGLSRLPAFLFGAGSTVLFWKLARRVNVKYPLAATMAFALLPINVRYTTEARPYSQALFFGLWALLLILEIAERPSKRLSAGLLLVTTAGLYSQPFVIFPIVAAALSLTLSAQHRRLWLPMIVPLIGACLLFVPWWLTAVRTWNGAPGSEMANAGSTVFDGKLVLRVLREITGGGYAVGVLLMLAAIIAVLQTGRYARVFAASALLALALAMIAEDRLHYYFAARHLMFSVPLLLLASAFALQDNSLPARRFAFTLWAGLLVGSAMTVIRAVARPAENWELVAARLMALQKSGSCISSVVSGDLRYFRFFEPELRNRSCTDQGASKIALVADPYAPERARTDVAKQFADAGWRQTRGEAIGDFAVLEFQRD